MEFSINLFGGCKCNAMCDYCSAHLVKEEHPEIDMPSIIKTMRSNKEIKKGLERGEKLNINLWGGEPLIHTKWFDEIVEGLEKEFGDNISNYFISTNGIPIADKKVVDWVYNFNKASIC